MIELTLMTRAGCRLCDEMKTVIEEVADQSPRGRALKVAEVDVSTDPDLEARWGSEIPVLLYGGQEIARHRISASQLSEAISQLS